MGAGGLSTTTNGSILQVQLLPLHPHFSCLICILSAVLVLRDRVAPILLLWPQASPKAYQHCAVPRLWLPSRQMQSSWGRKRSPLKAGPKQFHWTPSSLSAESFGAIHLAAVYDWVVIVHFSPCTSFLGAPNPNRAKLGYSQSYSLAVYQRLKTLPVAPVPHL